MKQALFIPAYAKINLTLDVLGRREDGYHRLASAMQTIALADTLLLREAEAGDSRLVCDRPDLETDDNLVLRAVRLMQAHGGVSRGIHVELRKVIPSPGGLGGGSSDGASVLRALDALWGLRLADATLIELAARLGSDAPFFIHGGTALITGRGEYVEPLPDAEPLWLALAKAPVEIATGPVFRALSPADYSDGAATEAVVSAVRAGQPLPFEGLYNALEAPVSRLYPAVAATRDALREAGAPVVRLSGSGPTLYAPFRSLAEAAPVCTRARERGLEVWLTHTVTRAQARTLG